MIYRVEITKNEQLRYISHLDYANLLQRCIRRAKLPAAYSEGFNPHMKVSFASALALGITTDAEYADIELTKDVCQPEFFSRLSESLPEGINLLRAKKLVDRHHKSMNALVDMAVYKVILPADIDKRKFTEAVRKFNNALVVVFVRERMGKKAQKGRMVKKEIDIKKFLAADPQYDNKENSLLLKLRVSSEGTVKPSEVTKAICSEYIPDFNYDDILINRTELLAAGKNLLDIV